MTSHEKFDTSYYVNGETIQGYIRQCKQNNHVQQVAYSVYEEAVTHICFTCKTVNTTMMRQTK